MFSKNVRQKEYDVAIASLKAEIVKLKEEQVSLKFTLRKICPHKELKYTISSFMGDDEYYKVCKNCGYTFHASRKEYLQGIANEKLVVAMEAKKRADTCID
jgi:transposase-like protein